VLKKSLVAACAITLSTFSLTACGSSGSGGSDESGDDSITMGFAQVGAESGWRTANTKSIKETAKAEDVNLKFSDAQQKQENQIKAIRSYIQQKVDVIAFSPVVETGWDTVLVEAKRANIPVILTDRSVDSPDKSLYKTFIGSDFVLEGKKAGEWLVKDAGSAFLAFDDQTMVHRGKHRNGIGQLRPSKIVVTRHRDHDWIHVPLFQPALQFASVDWLLHVASISCSVRRVREPRLMRDSSAAVHERARARRVRAHLHPRNRRTPPMTTCFYRV